MRKSLKGSAGSAVLIRREPRMADPPLTQPSLLVRLRDAQDDRAWTQFVEIYAPLVYGYARRQGLQDADAADLTQEVLRAVATAVGRLDYDPQRGSFRSWLFTVVRNKLRNFLAGRARQCQGSGDSRAQEVLEAQPDRGTEADAWWEREYEQRLFAWAAEQVKGGFQDTTWQAFWQTAVEGQEPRTVAAALGVSVGAVYIAKSRVLTQLRRRIQQIQEE
jgi:RNA polymerase sigma-70 factor (ECF subfamily)